MPTAQKPGAVMFAKDVACIATFYEKLVPMRVVHTERELIVLESRAFQLVVHGIPPNIARSIRVSTPPRLRTDVATKLILPVTSIAAARAKASSLGGGLKPKKTEFVARGFRACDGHDPEGNVVQFRESAQG